MSGRKTGPQQGNLMPQKRGDTRAKGAAALLILNFLPSKQSDESGRLEGEDGEAEPWAKTGCHINKEIGQRQCLNICDRYFGQFRCRNMQR